MQTQRALGLGAAFIVVGELCFATMGVGIRFVSLELPNEMIVFARNLVGLSLVAPWLLRRGIGNVATAVPALHLLRAIAGVAAMYCFFYAIAHLPLAEAMLLKLTAPVFMPLIALLWLHERVTALLWVAIGIGFCGVLVILDPNLDAGAAVVSPVALIGLLGGVLAALAKVTVRRLSRSEPPTRIVFYFALIAGAVSAIPLLWAWQTPSPSALLWLLGIAVAATLGQLALTRGLSLAPASRMGAFGYFAVVFGAAYGALIWDEALTWSLVARAVEPHSARGPAQHGAVGLGGERRLAVSQRPRRALLAPPIGTAHIEGVVGSDRHARSLSLSLLFGLQPLAACVHLAAPAMAAARAERPASRPATAIIRVPATRLQVSASSQISAPYAAPKTTAK
jgi:drug/metabolite transporter (DMT)-like permease